MLRLVLPILCCLMFVTPVFAASTKKNLTAESNVNSTNILGWNNVTWGMTLDDVKKLYPELSEGPADGWWKGKHVTIGIHLISEYFIFTPVFCFDNTGKLYRVTLEQSNSDGSYKRNASEFDFIHLEDMLTGKYGATSYSGTISRYSADYPSYLKVSSWHLKASTITLDYLGSSSPSLRITYQSTRSLDNARKYL